ncbi:Ankyrin repeat and KH domain-containing protein mask [Cytospora mali]|uniref:Ankyrin repeat and KH domain-containing protein mask n=1 Tax=Cytospora mali TaxID=578113 RepID=A0A194V7D8_CYTMA|nr:Ankyrin repeat and KH domain-containing protein mask [Valsa mali var. pyri (nom. inval.)]
MALSSEPPVVMIPSLWDKAFGSLNDDLKTGLYTTKSAKRDIVEAVLREVEQKRQESARRRWKSHTSNGEVVIVRDVLEKIAAWANKFKTAGYVAVQFDPDPAALLWAAVRFLLHKPVDNVDLFGAMAINLDTISRIITWSRMFERHHLRETKAEVKVLLEEALIRLCSELMAHLANTVKFFKEEDIVRMRDNRLMQNVLARENEVIKIAKLADMETLQLPEAAIMRLSLQESICSKFVSEERYAEILDWLSPSPYCNHHEFVSQSRLPGVGKWLLSHPKYIDWQNTSSSSMFLLNGVPGCGKTTLCSVVVDASLQTAANHPLTTPLGYFYCANSEFEKARSSSDDIMRTILSQLALDSTDRSRIGDFLCFEYRRQSAMARANGLSLSQLKTKDCTRLILELAEKDPLTIFVDGLDSINEKELPVLLGALREIVTKADNVVKIFATSRSNSHLISISDKQIQITAHETQVDMEAYVHHQVHTVVTNKVLLQGNISPGLRSMLIQTLLGGAGERFIWVKLQIERVCRETAEEDVMAALENKLPEDLDQLYTDALSHIFKSGTITRDIAIKVFSWILYMRELLTPSALLSAVAIPNSSTILQLPQLVSICANLVVLDTKCNVIRFSHQSVQEFLERHEPFTATTAHRLLASTCIEACRQSPRADSNIRLTYGDFHVYSTMYWPVHLSMAQKNGLNGDLSEMAYSTIFGNDFKLSSTNIAWIKSTRKLAMNITNDHPMKPAIDEIPDSDSEIIFLTSVFGLDGLLDLILSYFPYLDLEKRNHFGHTPLYLAAAFGHTTTVTILVNKGANVNVECGRYGSPLHAACYLGHIYAVVELLKLGANTSCGMVYRDALQAASHGGKEEVALLLLERGSIPRTQDDYEQAVQDAARAGFVEVIKRLRQLRSFSQTRDKPEIMRKTMKEAIEGGHTGVVRQFLDEYTGSFTELLPPDTIALATLYNHKGLVEFLLDMGAGVGNEGVFGTPLRTACLIDCLPISRLLLDHGADIDACGPLEDSLQIAAAKGHTSMMKLLIDEGADADQQAGFYGTALQAAAYHGQQEAVGVLLDTGADVNAQGISKDAFHAAAENGHEDVMMLMLRKGYRFARTICGPCYMFPSIYKTLLRDASPGRRTRDQSPERPKSSSSGKIQSILDLEAIFKAAKEGSQVTQTATKEDTASKYRGRRNTRRENYPLEASAAAGQVGTVRLLLEHRKILGIQGESISEAIRAAVENGHLNIVQVLLDDVAKRQPVTSDLSFVVKLGRESKQPHVVDFALSLASEHCSEDEIRELRKTPEKSVLDLIGELLFIQLPKLDTTEAFVAASASGHLDALKLLAASWKNHRKSTVRLAIQRALVVSSEHGQIETVRYLLEELNADTNICAPDVRFSKRLKLRRYLVSLVSAGHVPWNPITTRKVSALQACLRGFAGLHPRYHDFPELVKRGQSQLEQVIIALLDHGARPNDLGGQTKYPLQLATRYCPDYVVQRFIVAGADVNASKEGDNALQEAAGRELSSVSVFHLLLDADATYPGEGSQADKLLESALQFFQSKTGVGDPDGRFVVAPSLEYVFKEGPGALVYQLLSRMPLKRTNDSRYGLILQMAALLKDEPYVDLLLSRGTDVNATGYYYGTALQAAARGGNVKIVQKLLKAGANVNILQGAWQTALRAALVDGYEDVVEILLAHGADMNPRLSFDINVHDATRRQELSETALQMAVKSDNISIVRSLLARGADAKGDDTVDVHPLIQGALRGNVDIVRALLDAGAPVNIAGKKRRPYAEILTKEASPLHAAAAGGHLDVVKELLSRGADIDNSYVVKIKPLGAAAASCQLEVLQLLLSAGANVTGSEALSEALRIAYIETAYKHLTAGAKVKRANKASIVACRQKYLDLIEMLLESAYGGNVPEPIMNKVFTMRGFDDSFLRLFLDYIPITMGHFLQLCATGSATIVQFILDRGVIDINGQDEQSGDWPLRVAASHLQVDVVKTLLSYSADVHHLSSKHGTVLMAALEAGVAPSLRKLEPDRAKEMVAGISLPTSPRPSPSFEDYDYCRDEGPSSFLHLWRCETVVQHLVYAGANTNDKSRAFGPPLHLACFSGSKALVELFLDKGADINETAGYFEKAIFAALKGANSDIVELLLERAPLTDHSHPDFGTPLDLAYATYREGSPTRKLFEMRADASNYGEIRELDAVSFDSLVKEHVPCDS